LALFVDSLGNVGGAEARDGLDLPEEVIEHVAPVAEHIENYAAAVGLAVVPRGALGGLPVALEHPIAEFAAHRENFAEEAGIAQHLEFQQPRQEELILHDAMLDARGLGL